MLICGANEWHLFTYSVTTPCEQPDSRPEATALQNLLPVDAIVMDPAARLKFLPFNLSASWSVENSRRLTPLYFVAVSMDNSMRSGDTVQVDKKSCCGEVRK